MDNLTNNIHSRILTKEECLQLPVWIYNKAYELENNKSDTPSNLRNCKYCMRYYVISCICDLAEADWQKILQEVKDVSELDRPWDV